MAGDFEVRGADDFLRLSKALKEAGRTKIRRELNKGIRDATKPLLPGAAQALAATLPTRLQKRGARIKQQVKVSTGRDPGVTIGVPFGRRGAGGLGASNARMLNSRGALRHPLYGNRDHWYSTPVPAATSWFDNYYSANARKVLPDVERALQRVIDGIVREAGH